MQISSGCILPALGPDEPSSDPKREAVGIYNTQLFAALRDKFLAALTRRHCELLSLASVIGGRSLYRQVYAGIRTVPLTGILGSESRCCDFDRFFRPLQARTKDRWLRVAVAMQKETPLPPVTLIQVGDGYYVRDGHHRLSVAHALGQQFIEAEVTVWQVAR